MSDRSKEKETTALTSVRTVHSRALTALDELELGNSKHDGTWLHFPNPDGKHEWVRMLDEDYDEMRTALEKAAELLEPWAKKGRRRR
jgi:hypothetical protein